MQRDGIDITTKPSGTVRREVRKPERRRERTLLHETVRAHWRIFVAEVEERGEAGASLSRFVVGEFERYLACGIVAHGFCTGAL